MGDGKKALVDFNKAIELDPNYVQTYIKRGSIFMEQGDAEKTFNEFETAISIDAEDPNIYYHRYVAMFSCLFLYAYCGLDALLRPTHEY